MKKAYMEPTIAVISLLADENLARDPFISESGDLVFDSDELD